MTVRELVWAGLYGLALVLAVAAVAGVTAMGRVIGSWRGAVWE